MKTTIIALACSVSLHIRASSADGWTTAAPREEIRPQFHHEENGGKSGHGALIIRADEREGLHGWWQKTFSVTAAASGRARRMKRGVLSWIGCRRKRRIMKTRLLFQHGLASLALMSSTAWAAG